MLGRRHLLALPGTAALAGSPLGPQRLPVTCAAPALRPLLVALDRHLEGESEGAFGLVEGPGGATLGGLAFGPQGPGPVLELFAGFPYGMAGPELVGWLDTAEGRALWTGGFAARGLRSLPCGIALAPGLLHSQHPVTHWAGLRVQARPEGILGQGLRRLGAWPVQTSATATLRYALATPLHHAIRIAPPFGAVLDLAWPEELLAPPLAPALAQALQRACATNLAASPPATTPPAGRLASGLSATLARSMAEALAACLAMPEAVALRAGPRFTAARLAALRFDPWS